MKNYHNKNFFGIRKIGPKILLVNCDIYERRDQIEHSRKSIQSGFRFNNRVS